MSGKTEGSKVAEAIERAGPSSWKDPSVVQDPAPDEAAAYKGEDTIVTSQQSSGSELLALDSCGDSTFQRVAECFMPQPRLPPIHCCCRGPSAQNQHSWEALQVPEPGAPGLPCSPESREPRERLPRGRCLIHNWVEERATNEIDQILSHEDSEGFRYRHGHLGLLTLEVCSPQASRTTHKDSYQHPGNPRKALRGKREAMLELLLHHQIRKEVDQEFSPPIYLNYESVTHHDYQKELDHPGPPPPTKPHNLQEQPETYWLKKKSEILGVSNTGVYDSPFRKNSSFSTPVSLSMDQPLPYGSENFPRL